MSIRDGASNPTTKVVARYASSDFRRYGSEYVIGHTLPDVTNTGYIRVRGTSTDEMEPAADGLTASFHDVSPTRRLAGLTDCAPRTLSSAYGDDSEGS